MRSLGSGSELVLSSALVVLAVVGCPGGSKPPAPVLESVEPRVTAANVPMHLVITGTGFGGQAQVPELAPTLTVTRTRDLEGNPVTGPSDSAPVPVTVSGSVERVEIDVALTDAAPPGIYGFRLTRRDGVSGDFPEALALVPPLGATGLDAGAVCLGAPSPAVGIAGVDFLVLGGVAPTVRLTDGLPSWEIGAFSATLDVVPSGCRQVPFARADLRLCTRLDAPLPAAAPPKVYDVVMTQPPPGDQLAAGSLPLLVDRPLGSIAFSQVRSALDAPLDLTIGGVPDPAGTPGIHVPTGGAPTAVVEGVALAVTTSGCQTTRVPGHDWCSTVTMTVPQGFPPGDHAIALSTMPDCGGQVSFTLTPRPSIASVAPPIACLRGQTWLQITGSSFFAPSVFLGGQELTVVYTCPPGQFCDKVSAVLFPFNQPPGVYLLAVENGSLPPALSAEVVPVTVAAGPPTSMIPTPQTICNATSRPVFVGFTEPATTITSVALTPWGGGALTPVAFTQAAQGVDITVPAGMPPGWYDVAVTEGGQCTGGAWQPVMVVSDWRVVFDDFDAGLGQRTGLEINWKDVKPATDPLVLPVWQASGGNPGGAASYAFAAGDPTWYFTFSTAGGWTGYDLSALFFDLRLAASSGTPVAAPDVRLRGNLSELHFALPVAPGPTWQRYVVPLDDPAGWTFVDAGGSRPATAEDLRQGINQAFAVWIRGLYADGSGETWLDNLAVELHH